MPLVGNGLPGIGNEPEKSLTGNRKGWFFSGSFPHSLTILNTGSLKETPQEGVTFSLLSGRFGLETKMSHSVGFAAYS